MKKEPSKFWDWFFSVLAVGFFFCALWLVMSRDVSADSPKPGGIEEVRESNLELQLAYEEQVNALRLLADNVIALQERVSELEGDK